MSKKDGAESGTLSLIQEKEYYIRFCVYVEKYVDHVKSPCRSQVCGMRMTKSIKNVSIHKIFWAQKLRPSVATCKEEEIETERGEGEKILECDRREEWRNSRKKLFGYWNKFKD